MNLDADYYTLLEVGRAASPSQIEQAYAAAISEAQTMSGRWCGMLTGRTKERIQAAYTTLSDAKRRAEYEEFVKGLSVWNFVGPMA